MNAKRYQLHDSRGDGTLWTLIDTMPLRVLDRYTNEQKPQAEQRLNELNTDYESQTLKVLTDRD